MTQVTIHTDGACSGNPGPAGWAAILQCGEHERKVVGGAVESTNNRTEVMAVIVGLEALKYACNVTVITDSQYVIGVLDLGWKRRANHDLLTRADALLAKHEVRFVKVQGHNGDAMNERCDQAARAEVERQRSKGDYTGTVCVGCGSLARNGNFCPDCDAKLTPAQKDAAWALACENNNKANSIDYPACNY